MRAPVAQSVVSSRRSRSVAAASITARISCGDSASGGCQRLLAGLTERALASEFDSTRCDATGNARLETRGCRPLIVAEFNIPIGRLNSPAPRFKAALRQRTLVFAASRSGQSSGSDSAAVVCNREYAVKRLWDDDELTAEWTLEPSDQSLLANKTVGSCWGARELDGLREARVI